ARRGVRLGLVGGVTRYLVLAGQTLVAVALAPALTGFIRWLKARLQGRRGAPPWQPYFDVRKLFGKEAVVSHTASSIVTATTCLSQIVAHSLTRPSAALGPGYLLAFAALIIVTLAETGRLPVDNPSTHLELTMIHEAMVLEYSGPYLALIEWGAALKLLVFLTLAATLFMPWGIALSVSPIALIGGLVRLVMKLLVLATAVTEL